MRKFVLFSLLILVSLVSAKSELLTSTKDNQPEVPQWILDSEKKEDAKAALLDDESSGDFEEDDEYEDEDDDDEYEEGSGLDESDDEKDGEDQYDLWSDYKIPDSHSPSEDENKDDFHFEDSERTVDDDLLSEYYDEEYEPDYQFYEYITPRNEETPKKPEEPVEPKDKPVEPTVILVNTEDESREDNFFLNFIRSLRPSYVYVTMASALLSFGLALAVFFVCRRSAVERRRRQQKLVPFVVSHQGPYQPVAGGASTIVKSYQRVPTSTRELLNSSSKVVNMNYEEPTKAGQTKPLLA